MTAHMPHHMTLPNSSHGYHMTLPPYITWLMTLLHMAHHRTPYAFQLLGQLQLHRNLKGVTEMFTRLYKPFLWRSLQVTNTHLCFIPFPIISHPPSSPSSPPSSPSGGQSLCEGQCCNSSIGWLPSL